MSEIKRKFGYVIVVCARWEARDISEWLCYYRYIGFDHVYLYCNDDDPAELYEAVLPFVDLGSNGSGFLDFFHFGLQGHQREMYFHFLKNFLHECENVCFFDVDEFLILRHHRTIREFVNSFPVKPGAIHFNWRPAGNSFHVTRPDTPVLSTYNRCATFVSEFTKILVNTHSLSPDVLEKAAIVGTAFWHDIQPLLKPEANNVNVLGEDVRGWYQNLSDRAQEVVSRPGFYERIIDTAFIFHISFKSEEDFVRRVRRGLGGQFHGQKIWGEKARSDIELHLAKLNKVEENQLREIRQSMLAGAVTHQIVKAPPGRNIAARCKATQSSVSEWSIHQDVQSDAEGVVDGRPSGQYHHHTDIEHEPWWQVDLGEPKPIREMRFFNRIDNARDRLRNFIIQGSRDGTKWTDIGSKLDDAPFGGIDGYPFIWTPQSPVEVRHVRIQGIGVSLLDFDQIEIYQS